MIKNNSSNVTDRYVENIGLVSQFMAHTTKEDLLTWTADDVEKLSELILGGVTKVELDAKFAKFYPDVAITAYRGENHKPLPIGRNKEYSREYAQSLTTAEKLEHQRAYLKNCILPACRTKLRDLAKSRFVREELATVNPDAAEAFMRTAARFA